MPIPPLETTAVDQTSTLGIQPTNIEEPAWSTLMDFLGNKPHYVASTLYNMWVDGKKPYIKQYDVKDESDDDVQLSWGGKRAHWQAVFGSDAPDTVHIIQDDLSDLIAELSHAQQYGDNDKNRKRLQLRAALDRQSFGDKDVYGYIDKQGRVRYPKKSRLVKHGLVDYSRYFPIYEPGVTDSADVPMEAWAHRIIEPTLWKKYNSALRGYGKQQDAKLKALKLLLSEKTAKLDSLKGIQ